MISSLLGRLLGGNKLSARQTVGNVVVGGNTGLIYQVFGNGQPPAPPVVHWADGLPTKGDPFEIFNLLSWKCRLAPKLIGRDSEISDLVAWAQSDAKLRIRFLVGDGGAGKTRLAAEVADILASSGWHAGFSALEQDIAFPLSGSGLLLLFDYPEAWPDQVKTLLRQAASLPSNSAPIRILLLSRRSFEEWKDDVIQCGASHLCDSQAVNIGALDSAGATALFKDVATRLAHHRGLGTPRFDDSAIDRWVAQNADLYALPLLITAAAVHFVDAPAETLTLGAVDIVEALVVRERTQLDRVGQSDGWHSRAASRLIGLGALREEMNASAVRRLASPELEIGVPAPADAVDALQRLGWWKDDRLLAATPDIVAAEMLLQVLKSAGDRRTRWLWAALPEVTLNDVELLGRRMHDMISLHGPSERHFRDALVKAVTDHPERARAWAAFLSDKAGFRLSQVGVAVGRALLNEAHRADESRAAILNDLSNRLGDVGDTQGALDAVKEAVDIRRRLAQQNPKRHAPFLALSLNNLAGRMQGNGDDKGALAIITEAVDIRRGLAQEDLARYAPDLAISLNNLSSCLRTTGNREGALEVARESTDIRRRLKEYNPERFAPDLASSLTTLMVHLKETGDIEGAFEVIREAIDIRRRLVERNFARYAYVLAISLNNLSSLYHTRQDFTNGLAAIREAVAILRHLAQESPARYSHELEMGLTNLFNFLAAAGNDTDMLETIRELVDIRRRLMEHNPARHAYDFALGLNNLSGMLRTTGDDTGALDAAREAVSTLRRLTRVNPGIYSPDLLLDLDKLADRLNQAKSYASEPDLPRTLREAILLFGSGNPAH